MVSLWISEVRVPVYPLCSEEVFRVSPYCLCYDVPKACALGISETVMGLSLGAIGTSFANLYASVITARAGQASMSMCQAFGSNTFNLCICLGLVWFVQTTLGTCYLGRGGLRPDSVGGRCDGCYMPNGLVPLCPYLRGTAPKRVGGSLVGSAVVVSVAIIAFVAAFVIYRGRLARPAAGGFFGLYFSYVFYMVLVSYDAITPLCFGSVCI